MASANSSAQLPGELQALEKLRVPAGLRMGLPRARSSREGRTPDTKLNFKEAQPARIKLLLKLDIFHRVHWTTRHLDWNSLCFCRNNSDCSIQSIPAHVNDSNPNSFDSNGAMPPAQDGWEERRALSGKAAIRACMDCRNAASRSVDNITDQLLAIPRQKVIAAVVALPARMIPIPVRGPYWLVPTRIFAPSGLGRTIPVWVGPDTIPFEVSEGELEALATQPNLEPVLRWVAGKLRSTAKDCCRKAVSRRLWPQTNKLHRVDVPYHRTRKQIF